MDINSVIIYLSVFLLSLASMWIAQRQMNFTGDRDIKKGQIKFIGMFFFVSSLIFPILLAGFRDTSVGIDINVYILPNFEYAQSQSPDFFSFYSSMPSKTEFLFAVLLYICGRFSNLFLLFSAIEMLILLPVIIVLVKMKEEISVLFGMAIYYFFFYNLGLCVMRQAIAMSFLFLAYFYITEKEYKKGIVISAIAVLFHTSAVIIIGAYLVLIWILNSKYRRWLLFLIVAAMLAFFIYYEVLAQDLGDILNIINARYGYYIRRYLPQSSGFAKEDILVTDFICKAFLTLMVTFFLHLTKQIDRKDKQWLILIVMGLFFSIFNGKFYEAKRIAYYFDLFIVLYASRIYKCFKKDVINKAVVSVCTVSVAFIYWLYFIMYQGGYGTNIYLFR